MVKARTVLKMVIPTMERKVIRMKDTATCRRKTVMLDTTIPPKAPMQPNLAVPFWLDFCCPWSLPSSFTVMKWRRMKLRVCLPSLAMRKRSRAPRAIML